MRKLRHAAKGCALEADLEGVRVPIDHSKSALQKPTRKRRVSKHTRKKGNRERTQQVKALEDLMRPHIFARDGNACVCCGGTKQLGMAHVLPKGIHPRIRFEPYNLMTMDFRCHLGNGGWHKDPLKWKAWFDEKYPGRYDALQIASQNAPKVDVKLLISLWSSSNANELVGECAGGGAPR